MGCACNCCFAPRARVHLFIVVGVGGHRRRSVDTGLAIEKQLHDIRMAALSSYEEHCTSQLLAHSR